MTRRDELWNEVRRLQADVDQMLEDFYDWPNRNETKSLGGRSGREVLSSDWKQPLTDIYETDKEIIATFDVPGIDKKDIRVNTTEDSIEVKAEKRFEQTKEEKDMHRFERSYSGFYRCVSLPEKVNPDKVTAKMTDGVLEVTMPKSEPGKSRTRQVTVQ